MTDDGPHMIAFGACICCSQIFAFNPNRVPSTTALTGQREPVCRACMTYINEMRISAGWQPFEVLPGAYDPGAVFMRMTLEPTGTIDRVNGTPARLWVGRTESGIDITTWVHCVRVRADADAAELERELNEIQASRELVSFDLRMVL